MMGCKCIGNTHCNICYEAMTDAFDKAYSRLKEIGMEDFIEAKEFMWDFFAERDKENAENINEP